MTTIIRNGNVRYEYREGEDAYRAAIDEALECLAGTDLADANAAERAADNASYLLECVMRTRRYDVKITKSDGGKVERYEAI